MNIILCGMPMSGKTTLGKKVAAHLKWTFIDTDCLMEAEGLSCREIYLKKGEKAFRELESQVITSLSGQKQCVIALGGGAMQEERNRRLLKALGVVVYLRVPIEILFSRFKTFPATLDPQNPRKSWEDLAAKRCPIFEAESDMIVDTFEAKNLIERISSCVVPLS